MKQIKPTFVIPNRVHCAVIRYHSRRVTCLEFHPTRNNIILSGDKVHFLLSICQLELILPNSLIIFSSIVLKKGQLGVWDYGKVHERTVYGNIHGCILNNMKLVLFFFDIHNCVVRINIHLFIIIMIQTLD